MQHPYTLSARVVLCHSAVKSFANRVSNSAMSTRAWTFASETGLVLF